MGVGNENYFKGIVDYFALFDFVGLLRGGDAGTNGYVYINSNDFTNKDLHTYPDTNSLTNNYAIAS